MSEDIKQTQFEGWALVEIMGHRRAAGFITTEYIGQAAFLRIVTPEVPPTTYTLDKDAWINGRRVYAGSVVESSRPRGEILVGSGSIYAITPISEDRVLEHAPVEHKVIQAAERVLLHAAESNSPPCVEGDEEDGEDEVPY